MTTDVTAVVLAAGVGSRLSAIAAGKPKTLVEVNGTPMLGHILASLTANGVTKIVLCIGYEAQAIREYCTQHHGGLNISFVENSNYGSTNNMFSLYLARHLLDEDILLMNADLVFDPSVIARMLEAGQSAIAVDVGTHDDEAMKVIVTDGRICGISKQFGPHESYGRSIDVYRLNRMDMKRMMSEVVTIIEDEGERNQWTEVVLDRLFRNGGLDMAPLDIGASRWSEIDDERDLALAEVAFNTRIGELSKKRVFFLDRDGTLSIGDHVIDGAERAIRKIRAGGKKLYVMTNNSSRTPAEHHRRLTEIGLNIEAHEVLVSIDPALDFLRASGYGRLYWAANREVSAYIESRGFERDTSNPDALLLTYDTELTYAKLAAFAHFVREGRPYFATHRDVVCPTPAGPVPDIGTFISVVQMTAGRLPDKTFGKPDTGMIDGVLHRNGWSYEDAVVIGDRLYTDIEMAHGNNLTSVLVLTGETTRADYEASHTRAHIVVPNLDWLHEYL